jgi:hypothetical protein
MGMQKRATSDESNGNDLAKPAPSFDETRTRQTAPPANLMNQPQTLADSIPILLRSSGAYCQRLIDQFDVPTLAVDETVDSRLFV